MSGKGEEEVSARKNRRPVSCNLSDDGCDVRLNKENVHSRAYIAFKTEESVAKFSREYDGHVFKDKSGVYMLVCLCRGVSVM